MMKNKWVSIIVLSLVVIGLTACSNTSNENEPSDVIHDEEFSDNKELNDHKEPNDHEKVNDSTRNDEDEKNALDENGENSTGDQLVQAINVTEDKSITALVNKSYGLDETYIPDDLVTVNVPTVLENPEVRQLRQVAADALYEMFEEAEKSGIYLHARSGYRSYQTQVQLFNNYAEKHGEEAANRYSARPGHSEHQTGLVMDVTSEKVNFQLDEKFGDTKEGEWLRDNAHEFGFIIRYPKEQEHITGYIYEPWHIRYLGREVATAVYESGLTYEEFLVEEGIIHEVHSEEIE